MRKGYIRVMFSSGCFRVNSYHNKALEAQGKGHEEDLPHNFRCAITGDHHRAWCGCIALARSEHASTWDRLFVAF
jgi:hypothetical protein